MSSYRIDICFTKRRMKDYGVTKPITNSRCRITIRNSDPLAVQFGTFIHEAVHFFFWAKFAAEEVDEKREHVVAENLDGLAQAEFRENYIGGDDV